MKKIYISSLLISLFSLSVLSAENGLESLRNGSSKRWKETVLFRVPDGSSIYYDRDNPPLFGINGKSWWLLLKNADTVQLIFNGKVLLSDIRRIISGRKNPFKLSHSVVNGEKYMFIFNEEDGSQRYSYVFSNGKIYGPLKYMGRFADLKDNGDPFFCGEDSNGKVHFYSGNRKMPAVDCGITDMPVTDIDPPVGSQFTDADGSYSLTFRGKRIILPGPVLSIQLFNGDTNIAYTYRTDAASSENIVMTIPGSGNRKYNYINEFFLEKTVSDEILLSFCEFDQKEETVMKCRIRNRELPPVKVNHAEPEVSQLSRAGDDWLLSYNTYDETYYQFKDLKWKFPLFTTELIISPAGTDAAWITRNDYKQGNSILKKQYQYYYQHKKNKPVNFITLDESSRYHTIMYFDNNGTAGSGKLSMLVLSPDRLSIYSTDTE